MSVEQIIELILSLSDREQEELISRATDAVIQRRQRQRNARLAIKTDSHVSSIDICPDKVEVKNDDCN